MDFDKTEGVLVEDDAIIGMMIADVLETMRHSVAAEAGNLGRAMAQSADFDVAVLDMNILLIAGAVTFFRIITCSGGPSKFGHCELFPFGAVIRIGSPQLA